MAKLKRVVTFRQALAINLSAIIGAGIFVISGLAAGLAGPSAMLSIIIGAVVSIFTGLSFAELAHLYAREGGNYEYSREVLGDYAGVVAGFIWIVATIISGAAVALSFGGYFTSIFGIGGSVIIAVILVICLAVINYFGVKDSAKLATLLIVLNLVILAFFIIVGIFFVKPGNYIPFAPKGIGGMLVATSFVFFAYTGFARITMLGEEIKEPKKTIPKAIITSIIISGIVYLLVMSVLIGIVPYTHIDTSSSPLATGMFYATHSYIAEYAIAVGALIATLNVDLAMILGLSRVIFAMAREKDLPMSLGKVNSYGAPSVAIFAASAAMLVAIIFISFKQIVALSNAAALTSYAIANLAAIKLTIANRNDTSKMLFRSRYFFLVPVAGFLSTSILLLFLTRFSLEATFALLVVITLYYLVTRTNREKKGITHVYKHKKRFGW